MEVPNRGSSQEALAGWQLFAVLNSGFCCVLPRHSSATSTGSQALYISTAFEGRPGTAQQPHFPEEIIEGS